MTLGLIVALLATYFALTFFLDKIQRRLQDSLYPTKNVPIPKYQYVFLLQAIQLVFFSSLFLKIVKLLLVIINDRLHILLSPPSSIAKEQHPYRSQH